MEVCLVPFLLFLLLLKFLFLCRYMDAMDLGVLSDMPNIRKKACSKLLKQLVSRMSLIYSCFHFLANLVFAILK